MPTLDRSYLKSLMEREQARFVTDRPKSKALFERALVALARALFPADAI